MPLPAPTPSATAALPVHYQWEEAALRARLLTGLTTGRLTVKTEAEAAHAALLALAPPTAATPHPAAEWVDAHLSTDCRRRLLATLRQARSRAARGVKHVALKPVEYQQLQLLRALNDTRQRVLLSAADRTLLHDLGAWLPAAPLPAAPYLPLYSHTVPAGSPLLADDAVEDVIDLNTHLIPHREATFMVRVKGDSMQGAGIEEGDMLLVDRTLPPVHGKIVVAAVAGELTVKRLALRGDHVQLCPENAAYTPLTLSPDMDLQILGVVSSVIRKL